MRKIMCAHNRIIQRSLVVVIVGGGGVYHNNSVSVCSVSVVHGVENSSTTHGTPTGKQTCTKLTSFIQNTVA